MEEKRSFYILCKLPLGHDKSWTHHCYSSISVERCKWWQIPSSLITRVQLIGVTHRDVHAWHLAKGLSCLSESFRSGLLSECCQATKRFPLARAYDHLFSEAVLCCLHYSHLSQGELVNSIQILHVSMSGRGLCISYFCGWKMVWWKISLLCPQPLKYHSNIPISMSTLMLSYLLLS